MKQAKIDNILYVFDREPYVITEDTDADIIYVQQECIQGFQELNPSLTLSEYNYSIFQITKPVWYDAYMQEDEEGYTPEAVQPDETNWNIQMFSNGDRGVGLRLSSDDPTIDADRTDLQAAFESIGASSDDNIDDLVGEYDSDLAITPQVSTRGKKNAKSGGDEEEMTKIEVHKGGFGRYSFHSDNQVIMSVDYSDTSSDECVIDATGLSTGENEVITFSLINKQPITKQEAGIYFNTDEYTVDIHNGTTSAEIELVENPNNLPVEYSVNDPDLTLTVESSYITVGSLKEGDFTVTAYTPGNDYFLSGSAFASLEVTNEVPKIDPQISWAQEEYILNTYGGLSYIDCEYNNPNNITGLLASEWGDGPGPWSASDESTYIRFSYAGSGELTTGKVNISIGYLGDETYAEAWDTSSYITVINVAPVVYDDYPIQANGDQTQELSDPTDITPEDIVSVIKDNITWTETGEPVEYYPESYVPVPYITIYDGDINDNVKIVDHVSLDTLEDSSSQAYGAIVTAAGSIVLDSSYWTIKVYIPSTDYNGVHYRDKTVTFTDTFNKAAIEYPVYIDGSTSIMFDDSDKPTPQDIENTIMANVHDYDDTWMPPIQVNIYKEDSENPGEMISISEQAYEIYSNDLETDIQTELNESGAVVADSTVWYIDLFIPDTTYAGEKYDVFSNRLEFRFTHVTYNYPVTLLNNDIQFDPDVSDQDIEDAITGNLDGYDSSWMPEPTITVMYGSGDSDVVCSDVQMSQLDFSNDMSSITFGTTVWTVYYTIAAYDYAGEHYAQQDLEFTISFVDYAPTYEDYPVTLLSSTAEVEYEEGSSDSNYVAAVSNALMDLLSGYDDTWMPTPTCLIYAPDPEDPNTEVPITEDTEIGGSAFGDDLGAAFQESGAVVADQTTWHVTMTIPSSTYAGDDYQAWGSGDIYLSFVSPPVEPLGHLRLTSNQDNSTVAMIPYDSNAVAISLEYTTDEGATWNQWDFSAVTVNEGESICFRGTNNCIHSNTFVLTGNWSASGNIMSLLYGDNFEGVSFNTTNNKDAFDDLFRDCTALYDVSEIILPTNTTNTCYVRMFMGCSNIERAPYLPATTHASDAYGFMFADCTKLKYIKFNISGTNSFYNWVSNVAATGIMVNENPNFNASSFSNGVNGKPSGWTLFTSDPQNYDARIVSSNVDIYPSGECGPYDNISDIVLDIQNNFSCRTAGAAPTISIPDPNDPGGSNFVLNSIDPDNGADLETAIDTYQQNHGINIGDVWTATIDIPEDTIDGTLYLAWRGTFTISFQDNP